MYEIRDSNTGEVQKYGIGSKLDSSGGSPRAAGQVRRLNRAGKPSEYRVEKNITRTQALSSEQGRVNGYSIARQRAGLSTGRIGPPKNFLPTPKM